MAKQVDLPIEYDTDRIDEVTMALLYLTMFRHGPTCRAWKGQDWETLDRLAERGWILDPRGKAKSVIVTAEGESMAKELFVRHFSKVTREGD